MPNAKELIRPAKLQWKCSRVRSPQGGLILFERTRSPEPSIYGDSVVVPPPANGNTAGVNAGEARQKPRDECWEEATAAEVGRAPRPR